MKVYWLVMIYNEVSSTSASFSDIFIYSFTGTHVQLESKLRNDVKSLKNQWETSDKDHKAQKVRE